MPNTWNFFAKYFLARQFSMSRRQCSSNKLMALQTWLLFFVIHTVLKFAYVLFMLLIVYWIVRCLVSRNVKSTRNNDSKLFQKLLFLSNRSIFFPGLRHYKLDKKHNVFRPYDKIISTICARWNIQPASRTL